jgi:cytochrome P450
LSPGFGSKNITAMLPSILEEVVIFRDILLAKAGENNTWGPVFQLEALTTNLTFDVIGRATLGIRLDEQTRAAPSLLRGTRKPPFFNMRGAHILSGSMPTSLSTPSSLS